MKSGVKFVLLLLFCSQSYASDLKAGLLLYSYHFNNNEVFNEENFGVYGSYKGFTLGTFENSYYKQSYLVAYEGELSNFGPKTWNTKITYLLGVADGYEDNPNNHNGGYQPVMALAIRKSIFKLYLTGSLIHFGLEFDLRKSNE